MQLPYNSDSYCSIIFRWSREYFKILMCLQVDRITYSDQTTDCIGEILSLGRPKYIKSYKDIVSDGLRTPVLDRNLEGYQMLKSESSAQRPSIVGRVFLS